MLSKEIVVWWNEVEHDLYEENGYIFVVEIDLFNDHKSYYCKTVRDGKEYYTPLGNDIYKAIDKFNELMR
jgi:hypothetical protein